MTTEADTNAAPAKLFAVESRDRDDASLSYGKIRLRLPKWALAIGVILAVSIPVAIISALAYEVACLKYMGHPGNLKHVIEYQRAGIHTNLYEVKP